MSHPRGTAPETTLPEHLRCGYRSKICHEIRATKLDGSLHKLCEVHRRKANENQQKLHRRHRMERELFRQLGGRPLVAPVRTKRQTAHHMMAQAALPIPSPIDVGAAAGGLLYSDIELLELLLFDMHSLPLVGALPVQDGNDRTGFADKYASVIV